MEDRKDNGTNSNDVAKQWGGGERRKGEGGFPNWGDMYLWERERDTQGGEGDPKEG